MHSKTPPVSLRAARVAVEGAEGAACDMICGEKAIQAQVKLLLPTTPSSSPVLEDPKLGLAPHLLPLIR